MKLSTHQQIFTQNIGLLIIKANTLRVNLTFSEAYRTMEQQDLYYYGKSIRVEDYHLELISAKKRTNTLDSYHLKRLAVDFNFFINGRLTYSHSLVRQLGCYWEHLHPLNRWGGHFTKFYDAPHFEMAVL